MQCIKHIEGENILGSSRKGITSAANRVFTHKAIHKYTREEEEREGKRPS